MDEQRLMMLWRGRHLILLAVGAMLIVSTLLILATGASYEAKSLLRVDQAAAPANGSDAFNAQQASATQAVSYATLLTSTSFLLRVAPKIDDGSTYSAARLARHIDAHAIKDTNLIAFTFTASSRKAAVQYARAVANAAIAAFSADFVATRTRQQAALEARLVSVNAKIAALQADATPAAKQEVAALTIARDDITRRYGQVLSESSAPSSVIVVAGPPSAPGDPVSPRPLLYLGIALFLGLLIGVGLAWLRERLMPWDGRTSSPARAPTRDPVLAPAATAAPAAPPATRPRPTRAAPRRKANQ